MSAAIRPDLNVQENVPTNRLKEVDDLTRQWVDYALTCMSPNDATTKLPPQQQLQFDNNVDFFVGPEQPHRPKVASQLWNAMATKTLHPSDPAARCPRAVKAVHNELAALREEWVWREHP